MKEFKTQLFGQDVIFQYKTINKFRNIVELQSIKLANNGFMDLLGGLEQTERGNKELKRIIKLARRNNK